MPASAFDDLWRGIAHEWPSYLAYATSFWTIGGLSIHHGIFRRLRLANLTVQRLGFYGVVLALALLAPEVAAFGFLVIAVLAVLGPVVPLPHARWRRTG